MYIVNYKMYFMTNSYETNPLLREIDKISIIHVIVKLRTDGLILFKKKQRKKDIPIICSDTVYFCSFQRFQVNALSVCV